MKLGKDLYISWIQQKKGRAWHATDDDDDWHAALCGAPITEGIHSAKGELTVTPWQDRVCKRCKKIIDKVILGV